MSQDRWKLCLALLLCGTAPPLALSCLNPEPRLESRGQSDPEVDRDATGPLSPAVIPDSGDTLRYRIDGPDTLTPEVLRRTGSILEQRLETAGVKGHVQVGDGGEVAIRVELGEEVDRERIHRLVASRGDCSWHVVASSDYQTPEWFATLEEDQESPRVGTGGLRLLTSSEHDPEGPLPQALVVTERPGSSLGGQHVEQAALVVGDSGWPALSVSLDLEGGQRMSELTAEHVGRRLAIQKDGELLLVAKIKSRIVGEVLLEGLAEEEIRDLAALLDHGPLPLPLLTLPLLGQ